MNEEMPMRIPPPIESFVALLRESRARHVDEGEMLTRVRVLAGALAEGKTVWLTDAMCRPDPTQGFGLHLLHEEDDHSLAVFVVTWLPQRTTPPHDHGTWAVVAGLDGEERNFVWRRTDDGTRAGHADVELASQSLVGAGDVIALPSGTIHSVANEGDRMSTSLHVYGRHVNHTARSQFDPVAKTETPYKVQVAA
jgi:predicted metal-dependent enzyme (double-stranded beta helix superfamily)